MWTFEGPFGTRLPPVAWPTAFALLLVAGCDLVDNLYDDPESVDYYGDRFAAACSST